MAALLRVTAEPIDPRALEALVRGDDCGAVATFIGVVRDCSDDGRSVTRLSYEAYETMAREEFARIAGEAKARFGTCTIAVAHRVGDLRVGDVAVVVAVASRHRDVAFDACRYTIDALKQRAPIWKKEHYADGGSDWRENRCAEQAGAS